MAETSLLEAGASAASTAAALENLQVEASCSVCLEYLKEPVIIECGHNFCKACITRWWEDLERDFPCPVCRKTSRYRSLRPNRQLGSMVEIAKQLQAVKRKIRDESLCPQHHEALSLFCYEDQEAVCLICAISHTHRAHTVVPLDDATQEYKVGNKTHDVNVGEEGGTQRVGDSPGRGSKAPEGKTVSGPHSVDPQSYICREHIVHLVNYPQA